MAKNVLTPAIYSIGVNKMIDESHLKTLLLLREQPWEEIGKELVAYAESRALEKYWRRGTKGHLALGVSAEDLVQEIFKRTFEGKRNWKSDKKPSKPELVEWFKQQIDSVMYHLCTSKGHRREVFTPEADDGEDLIDMITYQTANLEQVTSARAADPEGVLLTKDKIEHNEKILLNAIAGDPELERMYDAIIDRGEFKRQEIAEDLGVPVEQVYSWTRKLRRRITKLVTRRGEREHGEAKAHSNQ